MNQKDPKILESLVIVKRSGQRVNFNGNKIAIAIKQAFDGEKEENKEFEINQIYNKVLENIEKNYKDRKTINVEDIQDIIEKQLIEEKYFYIYEQFKNYRERRKALRKIFEEKQDHKFAKTVEKLNNITKNNEMCFSNEIVSDFGETISKEYAKSYVLENKFIKILDEGIADIGNLQEYITRKTQGAHIDFSIMKNNSIYKYTDEIIKKIIKYKKEQYGEHTIASINKLYIEVVKENFKEVLKKNIKKYLIFQGLYNFINIEEINNSIEEINTIDIRKENFNAFISNKMLENIFEIAIEDSLVDVKENIYLNIKRLLTILEENLSYNNSIVSISVDGTYKSFESDMIKILYLKALFEIEKTERVKTIFKIDNSNEEDLRMILEIINSGKEIYIMNKPKEKESEEELELFSTGERIYENRINDKNRSRGRILLSTTSINLSRLGLEYGNNKEKFYKKLEEVLEIVKSQLIQRLEIQSNKLKEEYRYLFKDESIYESNKIDNVQRVRRILKNGVLNISLVGLYECSETISKDKIESQILEIIKFIKQKVDKIAEEEKLNFIISEEYHKKILKKYISTDKAIYGKIDTIDKEKYETISKIINYKDIKSKKEMEILGKYQEMISSVIDIKIENNENIEQFKKIVENLKESKVIFYRINGK